MNAVMNLRVPQNVGNFLTSCEPASFSRSTLLHVVSSSVGLCSAPHLPLARLVITNRHICPVSNICDQHTLSFPVCLLVVETNRSSVRPDHTCVRKAAGSGQRYWSDKNVTVYALIGGSG